MVVGYADETEIREAEIALFVDESDESEEAQGRNKRKESRKEVTFTAR